ncbi:AEC family transporter [Pedobacter nyackensis]|uniref:AEC family transporter n=1 Tax=Pedobacter nyackensis TaxID=475255 RepID=UPI0029301B07|nr:AEC family transporter [Pedobacter nyackensis]
MVNFVMIAFCIFAGLLFKKYKLIPADAHKGINTWILYVALPAASFKYIPYIEWSANMLFPIASMIVVWLGGWFYSEVFCSIKGYNQRTRSSIELATGYSNTSFIGFPLIAAYFGESKLGIAIICDQATFILLSTAGIICAIKGNRSDNEGINTKVLFKRFLTFPPLIGCILSLGLSSFIDLKFTEPFFDKLSATLGPLALFSIGLQLNFKGWKKQSLQIAIPIFYKLLIAPILVVTFLFLSGIKGDIAKISIFEAAMPTLLSTSIVAERYRLNTKLINLIIGISILISLLTTAFWHLFLNIYL